MKKFLIISFLLISSCYAQTDTTYSYLNQLTSSSIIDSSWISWWESNSADYKITFSSLESQLRTKYLDTAFVKNRVKDYITGKKVFMDSVTINKDIYINRNLYFGNYGGLKLPDSLTSGEGSVAYSPDLILYRTIGGDPDTLANRSYARDSAFVKTDTLNINDKFILDSNGNIKRKVQFDDDSLKINGIWYDFPDSIANNTLLYNRSGSLEWLDRDSLGGMIDSSKWATKYYTVSTFEPKFTTLGINKGGTNNTGFTTGKFTYFNGSKFISSLKDSTSFEPAITAGTTAQYWRGDKTWQTLDKTAVGLGSVTNNAQIYSLNSLTAQSQTFAIGSSGTAPAWSSATSTHTLNIPMASTSSVTAGLISKTDYDLFYNKQATLTTGNLTESVTGLEFDNTRQVIGGSATLSLTSGYTIPTTTLSTNWSDAYSKRVDTWNYPLSISGNTVSFGYNTTNLKLTSNQLNTIQDIATTSTPTFGGFTAINGTSNMQSVLPLTKYTYSLGSLSNKFLSLYASELWVETLVAQNTIATIGGRVLIGTTNILSQDLASGSTTMYVKYNNLSSGDRIYLEANGSVEFIAVTSSASGSAGYYYYTITRNLDGSGANDWYAGDAVFNTGTTGSGFIDLYSINSMKGVSQLGPTIVGNIRNSSTYNDWSEHWAIGNLYGLYGYGSSITYGVGLGKYASGYNNITVDATNGIRIRNYTTTLASWDNSGNILLGQTGSGQSNVYITSGAVHLRNNITDLITLNSDGTGNFAGNITSAATITGGTYQTATSGQRVKLNGTSMTFYDSDGNNISIYGASEAIEIDGFLYTVDGLSVRGSGSHSNPDFYINQTGCITRMNGAAATSKYVPIGTGSYYEARQLTVSDLTALTASKIMVTDASGYGSASSVASSELFTPSYGDMYDNGSSTAINVDADWAIWTGSTTGDVKNVTYDASADKLTVSNAGEYDCSYSISFNTNMNGEILWCLFKNSSTMLSKSRSGTTIATDDNGYLKTVSGHCLVALSANDYITLRVYYYDTGTVTTRFGNVKIVKIAN